MERVDVRVVEVGKEGINGGTFKAGVDRESSMGCWARVVEDRKKRRREKKDVRRSWTRCRSRTSGMFWDRNRRRRCHTVCRKEEN